MFSSPERLQTVSPVSEDATEDLHKAPGALEAQALVEQDLLPAEVGTHPQCLSGKEELMALELR